jgi:hypothetical protein
MAPENRSRQPDRTGASSPAVSRGLSVSLGAGDPRDGALHKPLPVRVKAVERVARVLRNSGVVERRPHGKDLAGRERAGRLASARCPTGDEVRPVEGASRAAGLALRRVRIRRRAASREVNQPAVPDVRHRIGVEDCLRAVGPRPPRLGGSAHPDPVRVPPSIVPAVVEHHPTPQVGVEFHPPVPPCTARCLRIAASIRTRGCPTGNGLCATHR